MLVELKNGRRKQVKDAMARVLIRKGLAAEVKDEPVAPVGGYQTRMMQAGAPEVAPYGYKADGTPRKRPGRVAKSEE